MIPRSVTNTPDVYAWSASLLAQGADRLNTSQAFLRKAVRWIAELPPDVREELLETIRHPACGVLRNVLPPSVPANATLQP
jgi:hypothetical protein